MKQRFRDLVLLVGHHSILDEVDRHPQRFERLADGRATSVVEFAARGFVAHGQNGQTDRWFACRACHGRTNSPLFPPTLCSSSTLPMLIPRSTALHMSY